jgi:two-component system, chemotaxis family, chemotaxis protein CheY
MNMAKIALVVDDSATMRQMVAFTLHQSGFETVEACDGKVAIAELEKRTFQLVITDLNMPVLDGVEFIRALRQNAAHKFTPVLMLTTETQAAKRQEAKEAGATGWLVKPFNPEKLLEVVAKVVR